MGLPRPCPHARSRATAADRRRTFCPFSQRIQRVRSDSDSVSPGSNPGSPATLTSDITERNVGRLSFAPPFSALFCPRRSRPVLVEFLAGPNMEKAATVGSSAPDSLRDYGRLHLMAHLQTIRPGHLLFRGRRPSSVRVRGRGRRDLQSRPCACGEDVVDVLELRGRDGGLDLATLSELE